MDELARVEHNLVLALQAQLLALRARLATAEQALEAAKGSITVRHEVWCPATHDYTVGGPGPCACDGERAIKARAGIDAALEAIRQQ